MAVSLSVIAAKDSAGTAIAGGLQAQDKSGAGTGPFTLGQVLIDGLAGVNMAAVTAANAVKVDGSAVTQPVSIATAPVLVAGAAIIGKVGIDQTTDGTTNKVRAILHDGTTPAKVAPASTAPIATDPALIVSLSPNSAGIMGTGSQASPNANYLSTVAAGDIAAAATDSGNPVKIGGVGKTANPTAVTDGQRANALFDKLGKQIVVGAIRDLKAMQSTTITASTSETTIVTAVASTFLDLYGLVITNTSATVTKVTIKDSTAGTTRAVFEIPATETRGFMLPVDSGLPQATVNTAWTATCGTSVSSVEIAAYYVKNI